MKDKENFEILIPPKKEHLSLVRQFIDTLVNYECPSLKDRLPDLQLCASEAVTNSISAHTKSKSKESIIVRLLFSQKCVELQVQDKGRGFNLAEQPIPDPNTCVQDTGWGLELIKLCSDSMEIDSSDDGTLVRVNISK